MAGALLDGKPPPTIYGLPLLSVELEDAAPPAGGDLDPVEGDPGEEFEGGFEPEPGIGFEGEFDGG
ncbi:hypothetical protein AYI69_g1222, partial [Smittium culicis]